MQQKFLWLCTSIFCKKSRWHILLQEIALLKKKMRLEESGFSSRLEFNYVCGENIRFALLVHEEQADCYVKQIDDYFKHFFSVSNFFVQPVTLPVEGIFLPFLENTIQYGLYKSDSFDLDGNIWESRSTASLFSDIMIEGVAGGEIDDEVIVTFALCLKIALLKICITEQYASFAELNTFYNCNNIGINDFGNIEKVLAMAQMILNPGSEDGIPTWLQKWMNLCETALKHESAGYPHRQKMWQYRFLVYNVYKPLGINSGMERMLCSFIKRILQSDIPKSVMAG